MNGDVYIIDGNRFERNMSIEIYNPATDSSKIIKFDSIDAGQGYDSILIWNSIIIFKIFLIK